MAAAYPTSETAVNIPAMLQAPETSGVTRLVRHLPYGIPHDVVARLFSQYGASEVRPCSGGRMKLLLLNGCGNNDSKSAQVLVGAPIAPKLGLNYPFPPVLQYAYPPPDANILASITNALIAVPPLYTHTHVLHLMNKMNGPPPFRMPLPTPPLPKAAQQSTELDHQSISESEMESDEDTGTQKVSQDERKEDTELEVPAEEPREEESNLKPFASVDELEMGRLPPQDILSLPMFKNYTAGNPSLVLYIKNLAKDVISHDFYYIFGSQFGSIEAAKSSLGIRLMQEGRMRRQAFLTFPSVEVAHRALNLVNGFVFKGKPMIIQFGRNPGAAKSNE